MSRFKDPSEWRDVRDLFKTKICTLFSRGHCPREKCNFAHGDDELRKLPPVTSDRGRFGDRRRSPFSPRRGRRSYSPPLRRRSRSPDSRRREGWNKRARGDVPSSARSDRGDDEENSSAEEQGDDEKKVEKEPVKEVQVSSEGDGEKGNGEKGHKEGESRSEMAVLLQRLETLKKDIQNLESQEYVFQNLLAKNERKGADLEEKLHAMEQELEESEERSRRAASRLKRVMKAHIKVSKTQEELKRWQAKLVKVAEEAMLEEQGRPLEETRGGTRTRDDGFFSEDGMGASEGNGQEQRKRKAVASPGASDRDRSGGGGVEKEVAQRRPQPAADGSEGLNTHETDSLYYERKRRDVGNNKHAAVAAVVAAATAAVAAAAEHGGSSVRRLDLNTTPYSMDMAEEDADGGGRWQEQPSKAQAPHAAKTGESVKQATAAEGKAPGRGWRLRREELPDNNNKEKLLSKEAGGGAEENSRPGKDEEMRGAPPSQETAEDAAKNALSLASSRISFQLKGDKIGFGFKSAARLQQQKKEETDEKEEERQQPAAGVAAAAGTALSPMNNDDDDVPDVILVTDQGMKDAPSFIPFSSSYVAKGNEDEEVDIDGSDDGKGAANGRDSSALPVDMDLRD